MTDKKILNKNEIYKMQNPIKINLLKNKKNVHIYFDPTKNKQFMAY